MLQVCRLQFFGEHFVSDFVYIESEEQRVSGSVVDFFPMYSGRKQLFQACPYWWKIRGTHSCRFSPLLPKAPSYSFIAAQSSSPFMEAILPEYFFSNSFALVLKFSKSFASSGES
jgi:hypothetical protein